MSDRPRPTLTIGMATFDDYDGCWATLMSLRRHHNLLAGDQLLVVDNNPASAHGMALKDLCQEGKANAKYVPLPDAVGTSAPRDRVFREAAGDVVVCVDCHVLLDTGALDEIRDWYQHDSLNGKEMLCGVLLNDNGTILGTQFNDVWRAEMWGVWGTAWQCKCWREDHDANNPPLEFTPIEGPNNALTYRTTVGQSPEIACARCGRLLPEIGWGGHERILHQAGYYWRGLDLCCEPFEVLGQGLGLFAMRRDAWVGFHPHARGFGGEELYVHAKVRAAGGRVICHPGVRWTHRFGRPGGVPYQAGRYLKVRNYVLEFQELGWDLTPIHEHFVASKLLSEEDWKHLLADPVAHVTPGRRTAPPPIANPRRRFDLNQLAAVDPNQPPPVAHNLDTLFAWAANRKRDLDQHAAKIREIAGQANHVTAIVKRREWDVFLLAGRPDDLVVYTTERDLLHGLLHKVVSATETNPKAPRRIKHYTVHTSLGLDYLHLIEPTELLVLDTIHHADQLAAELATYAPQVTRRILIRGTQAFGEKAEDGDGPGLLVALRQFMRDNPEWSVIYHSPAQYGLTLISKDPEDKPTLPGPVTLAANFAKAIAEHVVDGLAKVTADQLEARLQACTLCDQRVNDRCAVCGCYQQPKAVMRSSECPLGRWPALVVPPLVVPPSGGPALVVPPLGGPETPAKAGTTNEEPRA